MTRTRGQAKFPGKEKEKASTTSTKSNKNQNKEIKTRKLKILVERLDASQYSSLKSSDQQPDVEKAATKVKIAKEPEIESAGRATRSLQAKEYASGSKAKLNTLKKKISVPEPTAGRVTREGNKPTEEVKKKTEEQFTTARATRGRNKVATADEEASVSDVIEEVPKVKELVVRVRKVSASTCKNDVEEIQESQPKKRGRPRKAQSQNSVKVVEETSKVTQASKEAPVETQLPKKLGQTVKSQSEKSQKSMINVEGTSEQTPVTKQLVVRVRKISASEYQNLEKENVEIPSPKKRGRPRKYELEQKSSSSQLPVLSKKPRVEALIDDDKLNGSLSPIVDLEELQEPKRETNKKLSEASTSAASQEEKSSIKNSNSVEKVADIPKRTTRGNNKQPQQEVKESLPKKKDVKKKEIPPPPKNIQQAKRPTRNDATKNPEQDIPSEEKEVVDISNASSTSLKELPTAVSPSLKIIDNPDQYEDDPYSFNASQGDNTNDKKAKKAVKPKKRPQAKPGSKMELLMHKETLDAVGYSLCAQNNPSKYKDEVVQVEKQINVPGPSIPKVAIVDDRPKQVAKRVAEVKQTISVKPAAVYVQKSLPTMSREFSTPLKPSTSAPLTSSTSLRPFHSKVWHSPPITTSKPSVIAEETISVSPFISNSPPIQSSFTRKMVSQRFNATVSTPFRVGGNLPSTFYMGLSKNDGTPSYSSDMVEKRQSDEPAEETKTSCENSAKTLQESMSENQQVSLNNSEPSNDENVPLPSNRLNRSAPSFLSDSNAENVEPQGFMKSPMKKRKMDPLNRSPLKALAIPKLPEGDLSSISVFNTTMEQSIPVKHVNVLGEKFVNKSLDLLGICEEESPAREESQPESPAREEPQPKSPALEEPQPESSARDKAREKSESRDAFGFDELLSADQRMPSVSTAGIVDNNEDIHEKLKSMKKYLPSKNNIDRDKSVFPSTPIKKSDVFKVTSDSETTGIRKFMTASTPLANNLKILKSPVFGNVSRIEETNETAAATGKDDTSVDETNIKLFEDQSELYDSAHRSYTRRKRVPEFLRQVEELEEESDDEDERKKRPTKSKRKKPNIEQTGEFKRFVQDKSSEFAEVDDYEMVIE